MTTFAASEIRLRRFLRDPNAAIWTSADLMAYYNDAQVEIAQKTNLLVRVEAHYYPPRYDWSYTHDWELGYLEGDRYQCLLVNQASGDVISFPWENNYYLDTNTTGADGEAFTHSFEVHYAANVADPPGILLHAQFDKMKYIAYDCEKIEPITEKELRDRDRYYRSTTGQVTHYWRPDEYSNLIYLYPLPSSTTIQEPDVTDTFATEGISNDLFIAENGEYLIFENGDYILLESQSYAIGSINSSSEAWLDETDYGLLTDHVDTEDALFTIYTAQPLDIGTTTDESEFPDFMTKYIEYATLERAYSADTDGFIPSLRDYWKLRKEIGLKALAKFQRLSFSDRDYRLGGSLQPTSSKRLRLPEGYPAI